jgi:uncharacterized protein YgbK (DUF1537 family)
VRRRRPAAGPLSRDAGTPLRRKGAEPPRRIGVVADDLTGAGDVALAFYEAGWPAEFEVHRPGGFGRRPSPRTRVWVLDTESRSRGAAEAARRTREAVRSLRRWGADFLFKKIDSTLRGPLREEFEAFAPRPSDPVAFVPAFPRLGRTTRAGRLYVHGRPLHRTPFSRDPLHPVGSSSILRLLSRRGRPAPRVWVPDVWDRASLRRAARRVALGNGVSRDRAVGSAGFAAALAGEWRRPRGGPRRARRRSRRRGDVLVLVGSLHPASRRQAGRLRAAGGDRRPRSERNVFPLTIRPNSATKSVENRSPARDRWIPVTLSTSPRRRGDPRRALRRLLALAGGRRRPAGAVVTGGETAHGLVRRWKLFRWRVLDRIEPGVPLCAPVGGPGPRLVLKPGGFGSEDVLIKAVHAV